MTSDVWICISTFLASAMTLLAGFGLATILTPVIAFVYDVKLAILLVAIVHLINNGFKLILFRRYINREIIRRFGVVSIVGAVAGAFLQGMLYSSTVKLFLGVVLILLSLSELLPGKMKLTLPRKIDFLGGFLSGLLGGLVGNQGAIRSAYLLNYSISKEEFIGTACVIALAIDLTRIPIYLNSQHDLLGRLPLELLAVVVSALLGTIFGKYLLGFFSPALFKKVVAGFVMIIGFTFALQVLN